MRVVIDASVRRTDGGRVLIGGSPIRVVRVTDRGVAALDRLEAGEAVGPSGAVGRLVRRLLDGGLVHPRWEPGAGPFTPADVTVVVPTLDDPAGLARTLAALSAGGPAERPGRVVVVDDGSADPGSVRSVAEAAAAEVVRHPIRGGPSVARNAGAARATTPVVAFVDRDVEPSPGWLQPLLAHLADPAVAAVAPRVVAAPTPAPGGGTLHRFDADRSPLDLGPAPARVAPRTRVAYVPATAIVVRRAALEEVGGFDEHLRLGEDVDLVWRLVEAGHTVRYEPAVTVTHPVRPDLALWLRQRFDYGTSAAALAGRHPGALAPVAVSAWSAAAWAAAACGHPVAGAAVAAAASAQLPARLSGLERPWPEGLRLALGGTWGAWRPLASAVTRAWWPIALGAALVSRRARPVVAAAALVPPLLDWWEGDSALDPIRYTALRLADDLAYGAGVWVGCGRERTVAPLRPDLRSWPGRRSAVEAPGPR